MGNLFGWVTFKELIDDILLGQGDSADHGQFMRYINFAVAGYEDLRLHELPATKPVLLPVSTEIRAVMLPNDFLRFVSVGVMSGDEFHQYSPKSATGMLSMTCGVDSRVVSNDTTTYPDDIYTGYYYLDLENQRILIDAPLDITEVVLNYTPTGVRTDGITYIPRMCAPVIKTFVEWNVSLRDKNTIQDKQWFYNEYTREKMKFIGLQYNSDELFVEYYDNLRNGLTY